MLDAADLQLAMLAVLTEQPRTGLGTIQALAARFCAGAAASAAEVYPGLMLLEETGFLSATRDEAGHRVYALSEAGAAHLAAKRLLTDAILADAADAARDAVLLMGRRHRPRCCRRTLAAIASGTARTTGPASAHPFGTLESRSDS
jgi:DNA-binding PadR family transcriptional regulator